VGIKRWRHLRDGGHIIIGVREEPTGFIAESVCDENLNSYNVDKIRDDISNMRCLI
jgi:hypothetical protein